MKTKRLILILILILAVAFGGVVFSACNKVSDFAGVVPTAEQLYGRWYLIENHTSGVRTAVPQDRFWSRDYFIEFDADGGFLELNYWNAQNLVGGNWKLEAFNLNLTKNYGETGNYEFVSNRNIVIGTLADGRQAIRITKSRRTNWITTRTMTDTFVRAPEVTYRKFTDTDTTIADGEGIHRSVTVVDGLPKEVEHIDFFVEYCQDEPGVVTAGRYQREWFADRFLVVVRFYEPVNVNYEFISLTQRRFIRVERQLYWTLEGEQDDERQFETKMTTFVFEVVRDSLVVFSEIGSDREEFDFYIQTPTRFMPLVEGQDYIYRRIITNDLLDESMTAAEIQALHRSRERIDMTTIGEAGSITVRGQDYEREWFLDNFILIVRIVETNALAEHRVEVRQNGDIYIISTRHPALGAQTTVFSFIIELPVGFEVGRVFNE